MLTQELLDFIKSQKAQNKSDEEIKKTLAENGWPKDDVEEAFGNLANPNLTIPNPQSPPPDIAQTPASETRGKKKLVFSATILAAALLLAGASYGYAYWRALPQKTFDRMLENISKTDSAEITGNVAYEIEGQLFPAADYTGANAAANEKINFNLDFDSAFDNKDKNSPKFRVKAKISGDANSGEKIGFDGEVRGIDKKLYLNVSSLPNTPLVDLTKFANIWISADQDFVKSLISGTAGPDASSTSTAEKLTSSQQIEKIQAQLRKYKIFKAAGKSSDEKINGVATRRIKIAIDKQALKKYLVESAGKIENWMNPGYLDENLKYLDQIRIEIWIGKKDSRPYKFSLTGDFPKTESTRAGGKLAYTLFFKNYDQPVKVETPEKTTPFQDIVGRALGKSRGDSNNMDASGQSPDQERYAKIYGIQMALEAYFSEHGAYPAMLEDLKKINESLDLVSPVPAGGTCTEKQNRFTYKLTSPKKYELKFCLGKSAGGLSPGVHTATPEGIK